MATVEEWDEFTSDYSDAMEEKQSELTSILNDPSATAEQKAKAREDFAKQMLYLQWVQEKNEEIQQSGIAPTTIAIPGLSSGAAVYIWGGDSKIYPVTVNAPQTAGKMSDIFTLATSQHFDIKVRYNRPSATYDNNVIDHMESNFPPAGVTTGFFGHMGGNGIWTNYFSWTAFDARGNLTDSTGYWNYSNSYAHFPNMGVASASTQPPTITSGSRCRVGSWNGDYQTGGIIASGYMEVENDPAVVDDPWDYYNEELLPDVDPDNAAFPDGYSKGYNPDDPSDDPTVDPGKLPHDDGDTPLPFQDNKSITAPSMFITQYICSDADISALGANLWSSWIDPNKGSDTAKNFMFDYFQDTGTFNITTALDYIISLRVFPFAFSTAHVTFGVSDGIYMGTGHTNFSGTMVNVLNEVNGWIDAGKISAVKPEKPYEDFRDMYNCSIQAYLPFCGSVELNPVEVINREVSVKYYIDFQSASCTAVVFVTGDKGKYPIASKSGQIGFMLPMTATNSGQLAAQFAGDATRFAGAIGNFALDLGKSLIMASTMGEASSASMAANAASKSSAAVQAANAAKIEAQYKGNMSQIQIDEAGSSLNLGLNIANQALDVLSRSGVGMPLLSGGGGCEALMFQQGCYLQIRRGKYVNLDEINYGHVQGHMLAETKAIEEFSGFCVFTSVDTTGLSCHADEVEEIVSLLQSGVYV